MSSDLDLDEIIDSPHKFGKEQVINIIPYLVESQRMRLKLRVKELLRDETSLPFSEQNGIFISDYKEIIGILEGSVKQSVTYHLVELIGLKDRTVKVLLKTVKREEANIRKILNVCFSAYTGDPVNLAYVSESSTGKTYLVESVTKFFPAEDLIVLKSISRKAFTRERGKLVLKTFVIAGQDLCIFAGIKLTPIAGLILTPVHVWTVVSVVRSGGVENDTKHEGERNGHKVHSQGTQHIKEQREKVSKIRTEEQAE